MTKKDKRVGMLIALINSMSNIEADAENQDAETLASNMKIMQEHVKDVLALDGIKGISE